MSNIPTLRPRQQQAADDVRVAFRKFLAVLLVAHTAFGKTILFCYVVASAAIKGKRVLILAHRQELISQISQALTRFGVVHGIISPQFSPNYRHSVQVASIATMNARFKKIPAQFQKFDLVILDEAHHLLATNTFGKVYDLLSRPRILGVTATPERADGKGLGEGEGGVFQEMVLGPSVEESIAEGYLSDFAVYAPANRLDLSDVHTKMGDFDKHELAELVDKPMVTGSAVAEYAKRCPTYPAVVFCISIEHCHHVAAEFQAAGFDFRVIDGSMDDGLRKSLINGLGKTHMGLVSCDIISEGTDVPSIACAIFLRPTKSLGLYIQQAGRAIRPVYAEGYDLSTREGRLAALANGPKPKAILLDHAGLCFTHGMIDEPRDWTLEGRKKGKVKKKEKETVVDMLQCKGCFLVFSKSMAAEAAKVHAERLGVPPGAPCCPSCFKAIEVKARKIETADGELHEVSREDAAARRKDQQREQGRAQSLEDLKSYAAKMGRSPKWAEHVWNARQRKKEQKKAPRRVIELPPVPSEIELSVMTLPELEKVGREQGWPMHVASDLYRKYQQPSAQ